MDTIALRTCSTCKLEKPITAFYKKRQTYEHWCKACRAAYAQQWHGQNRAKSAERYKQRKIETPEAVKTVEARKRRRYHERHPQAARVSYERYRDSHPERLRLLWRVKWHKRESIKRGVGGVHTADDVERQRAQQNNECYWCRRELSEFHVDHLIPLSKGGTNGPENIVCACPRCNLNKYDKMPWEFIGRLI